jgi:hypothetical protein
VQDKISDTVFRVIKKVFRSIGRVIASMFKTIFHHDGLNVDWVVLVVLKRKNLNMLVMTRYGMLGVKEI